MAFCGANIHFSNELAKKKLPKMKYSADKHLFF